MNTEDSTQEAEIDAPPAETTNTTVTISEEGATAASIVAIPTVPEEASKETVDSVKEQKDAGAEADSNAEQKAEGGGIVVKDDEMPDIKGEEVKGEEKLNTAADASSDPPLKKIVEAKAPTEENQFADADADEPKAVIPKHETTATLPTTDELGAADSTQATEIVPLEDNPKENTEAANSDPQSSSKPKKESKKRVRRVGKLKPRKAMKLEEGTPPPLDTSVEDSGGISAKDDVAGGDPATADVDTPPSPDDVAAARPIKISVETMARVLSKHDEKWNSMFERLVIYKV